MKNIKWPSEKERDLLDPLRRYKFKHGAKPDILRTYLKLHEGKLGAHWLWIVVQRVANGESADSVLAEYGYTDGNA